jgi:hypothetical protein
VILKSILMLYCEQNSLVGNSEIAIRKTDREKALLANACIFKETILMNPE